MRTLLVLILLAPATVLAAPPPEPVAFLPFKKLVQHHHLPRLMAGIPTTMAIDLARSGKVEQVPFSAVREVVDWRDLYRRDEGYTNAEAVALAKKVGAASVVVGTYEMPGGDVVIHCFLVRVSDGKALLDARSQGPLDEILRVQDEVMRKLFGESFTPRKRAAHHLKASSDDDFDTYRAYTSYTLGLTGSDTTRWGLLDKSLEEDPHFPYALEAMAELEKKTAAFARLAHGPTPALDAALRQRLPAEGRNASERHEDVMELCGMLQRARFVRELAIVGGRIYELAWSADPENKMRADGLYWLLQARKALRDTEGTMATAKKYLAEFSSGRFYNVIKREIRSIDREREKRDKKRVKLAAQLARLETRRIRKEHERCSAFFNNLQYLRAVRECGELARRHAKHPDPAIAELAVRTDWTRAQALYETGQFREARAVAERLLTERPEQARNLGIEYRLRSWPRE